MIVIITFACHCHLRRLSLAKYHRYLGRAAPCILQTIPVGCNRISNVHLRVSRFLENDLAERGVRNASGQGYFP